MSSHATAAARARIQHACIFTSRAQAATAWSVWSVPATTIRLAAEAELLRIPSHGDALGQSPHFAKLTNVFSG
jgi:hypothetical protein